MQITALKDHLAHTEAQLAAEKERCLSFYQALQTAKESLETDRQSRQVAINRAAAALTRLDHQEQHWRRIASENESLGKGLKEAKEKLEVLRGVEKAKALLEERLAEERRDRERAEEGLRGLEGERDRLEGEVERLRRREAVLKGVEETRDALQVKVYKS